MGRCLIALTLSFLLTAPAAAGDISTCGTTVVSRDTGRLVADLVCSTPAAVFLARSATLDLNGHSITMSNGGSGVECLGRRCAVVSLAGPGLIEDADGGQDGTFGILSDEVRGLVVANVDIQGFRYGIRAPQARASLADVSVSGCAQAGIFARKLRLTNVAANGNRHGMGGSKGVLGSDVTALNNLEFGIDSTGNRIHITGVLATGNGRFGVYARHVTLENGTVTGNGEVDVVGTRSRPRLTNVVCDTSSDAAGPVAQSWGVCAADP